MRRMTRMAVDYGNNGTIMERHEIVSFWGQDNLRCWPEQCLRDLEIPQSSKSYLINVGLPAFKDEHFQFDPLVGNPPKLSGRPQFRTIGVMSEFIPICLDERLNGCVMSMDTEMLELAKHINPSALDRYINSNVERFAECLILFVQLRRTGRLAKDADFSKLAKQFERDLLKVDPTVFNDPENLWAVTVWEMKEGLGLE
jgi:hypothetical protein